MPSHHLVETLKDRVKKLCQIHNIRPQYDRGQNFLIDASVIDVMLKVSRITKDDTVLEIGSGLGILTEALSTNARRVVAVEVDQKLFSILRTEFLPNKHVEVVLADVLHWQPSRAGLSARSYKVVANLPYQVTSKFLRDYLESSNRPSSMTLLLQKEVVERICAKPGDTSMLSIAVQLYGTPEMMLKVGREKFWPAPDVDSAVVYISNIRSDKEVDNFLQGVPLKFFWRIVKIGFSARRKMLKNNLVSGLHGDAEVVENSLNKAKLNLSCRAQDLSLEQWVELAKILKNYYS